MAPSPTLALLLTLTLTLTLTQCTQSSNLMITLVNNCPFTIWPAIQPNSGHPNLEQGGFPLPTLTHRSFPAPPTPWSGRIWPRTHCSSSSPSHLSCATGDCSNLLHCSGSGGSPPATLVQLSLHHGPSDLSSYAVSLVDGFNVPLTITPHEGHGTCPVVGCREDLLRTCPPPLRKHLNTPHGPLVVACKSGCEAFGTDDLCCRGRFNDARACRPSGYSEFFKRSCPATFTYAHDTPSLTHQCSSPRELKVIFCH